MAEIGGTKPDVEDLHWADGSTPNPTTEPNESKKDDGFIFEDIPPASEENWWRKHTGDLVRWIAAAHSREFETLTEAIIATSYPETFKIRPPSTGMTIRGSVAFNVQGPSTPASIDGSCTDGQRIYYIQDDDVIACNPETGAVLWNVTPRTSAAAAKAIDCDGNYVIVGFPYDVTEAELYFLDPSNGSTLYSLQFGTSSVYDILGIASNGKYAAILAKNSATGADISIYDLTVTPPSFSAVSGNIAGNSVNLDGRVVIDDEKAFAVYDDTFYTCLIQNPATSQTVNSTSIFTGPTIFYCLSTDGLRVYVVTQRNPLIVGGNANLICFNRETAAVVYTRDLAATNLISCTIDENYLYFSTPTNLTGIVEKYDCIYTFGTLSNALVQGHGCDGLSFVATDGADYIKRFWKSTATKYYMKALDDDDNRRPYYNLAIPIGDEI